MHLVPGRECGACTACCTHLRIEDPDLRKLAGTPCQNLSTGNGCSIYPDRPQTCRNWYCGWRYMPQLNDQCRPDQSEILIRLAEDGLIFEPINSALSLNAEWVLGIIGALIEETEITVYISVPTKPGFTNSRIRMNEKLAKAVASRNGYAVQKEMLEAILFGMKSETDLVSPL